MNLCPVFLCVYKHISTANQQMTSIVGKKKEAKTEPSNKIGLN